MYKRLRRITNYDFYENVIDNIYDVFQNQPLAFFYPLFMFFSPKAVIIK